MEQHFEIWDFIQLAIFLGSITFCLGAAFQIFIAVKSQKKQLIKIFSLVFLTRILTLLFTIIIWFNDIIPIDVMFGPILLPALIPEIVLSPLLLKMFGYSLRLRASR